MGIFNQTFLLFFAIWTCYMPIIGRLFPRLGVLNIEAVWISFYLLLLSSMLVFFTKERARLIHKWHIALVLCYAVYFSSVIWSPNYSYDGDTIRELVRNGFVPLVTAILAFILFQKQNASGAYLRHFIAAALIMGIIAIYDQFTSGASVNQNDIYRASATLGNPNALAIVLVLSLSCILYAMDIRAVSRPIGWIIFTVVITGVACTVSRKGIITAFLTPLIYYAVKRDIKRLAVFSFTGCLVVVIVLVGAIALPERFSGEVNKRELTNKKEMLKAGWDMFIHSPLIGLGYQGYSENFNKYFPDSTAKRYDAHNIYITILSNNGVAGFIPFMCIFFYPLLISFGKGNCALRQTNKSCIPRATGAFCYSTILPFMASGYFAGGLFYNFIIINLLYANITIALTTPAKDEIDTCGDAIMDKTMGKKNIHDAGALPT